MPLRVLILAAGKGVRMNSNLPKVVHQILNKPMISYVIDSVKKINPEKIYVIVGYQKDLVQDSVDRFDYKVEWVYQSKQLGTGHAIKTSKPSLGSFKGDILIVNGDCPGIKTSTLKKLIKTHKESKSRLSLISSKVDNPTGYGRIKRSEDGKISSIVEEKDADAKEKKISEINSGIYCVKSDFLWKALDNIKTNNKQKEYYLPDIIKYAVKDGQSVNILKISDPDEILGVNNRKELSVLEEKIRMDVNEKLQKSGVTIVDPSTTFISPDVKTGKDTVIFPNTYIYGNSSLGPNCHIGPNVFIDNSRIRNNVEIRFGSFLNNCIVGNDVTIGPYAHLRPEANVSNNAKIGNFVEIKKSEIGEGSKVPHLSYIGDASVGKGVNIGAGTITCNYDGVNKHRTTIEDNVFIGSDSMLVAPIKIGKGATTAAGSTITKDVDRDSLAIERNQQKNIRGWNKRKKKK